jgi:hypothetical protein
VNVEEIFLLKDFSLTIEKEKQSGCLVETDEGRIRRGVFIYKSYSYPCNRPQRPIGL